MEGEGDRQERGGVGGSWRGEMKGGVTEGAVILNKGEAEERGHGEN